MKLHTLKLRGLSVAFPREVMIDFRALGPGVTCIVGGNGAGKSHLLSCSGAATLFREFPDYGESFASHVIDGCRDAFSELTFEIGGHIYRALVQADPLFGGGRGKTEGYLFVDGEPVAGPLVKDYDAAIAKILPPRDIFLATVFAAQGGGGSFFAMPKAARKDMFAQMLGLEHLQEYAERARDLARIALGELDRCKADAEVARDRQRQHADLSRELALAEEAIGRATAERLDLVADRDAKREAHEAAVANLAKVKAQAESAERERERVDRDLRAAEADHDRLTDRRWVNAETIAKEAAVAEAEADVERLAGEQRQLVADLEAAVSRAGAAQAALAAANERRNGLIAEYRRLSAELAKATAAAAALEAVADRTRKLEADEARLVELDAAAAAADTDLARLRSEADRDAETERQRETLEERIYRATGSAGALRQIDAAHPMCSACPLTSDARTWAQTADAARAELEALPASTGAERRLQQLVTEQVTRRSEISTLRRAVDAERKALAEVESGRALAARQPEIEAALAANKDRGFAEKALIDGAQTNLADDEQRAAQLRRDLGAVEAQLAAARTAAAPRSAIDAAKAEAPALDVEIAEAKLRVKNLEDQQKALAAPVDVAPFVQATEDAAHWLEFATKSVEAIDRTIAGYSGSVERCRGALTQLGDPAADLARLGRREKELAEAAADWALLEKAMGRDGIQALEIDAAGPGVTSLANELLASCYGNRFSLAIETTGLKKDGGLKEVFDVRIIDAQNGRDAKQGSGGEMVILDEALRLALAIYQPQQSGYELRTLWRDETAGALSPENADRYVQMLRRARELGGFEQVLFIAHSPDVWQQADSRLFVEAGAVTPDALAEAA